MEDKKARQPQDVSGGCIAYREDGRVCLEPARLVDRQRSGLVCAAHAPAAAASWPPSLLGVGWSGSPCTCCGPFRSRTTRAAGSGNQ
jgi:hypothetical protein